MRIMLAPDKFKGSLTAGEAAAAMTRGVRRACPAVEIDVCPVADGGEGTVDALLDATAGEHRYVTVTGPRGEPVTASWGLLGCGADPREGPRAEGQGPGVESPGTESSLGPRPLALGPSAVMEMASASGLALVPVAERDPTRTTTFGTGQLVSAALGAGARRIILGIGGSATTDGGCGAAQALGVRFFDPAGEPIFEPLTGGDLERIAAISLDPRDTRVGATQIVVACDVTNPLTGPRGAAAVYGPQKGATPEQVERLDRGLHHLAELIRRDVGIDIETMPGAGAAGGLGAGLVAFLGATLRPGIALVLEAAGFERRVAGCALCLTGEGRIDSQTAAGKAVIGVAQAARRHGVRTVALVGSAGPGAEETLAAGLTAYHEIGAGLSIEESIRRAAELLEAAAEEAADRYA